MGSNGKTNKNQQNLRIEWRPDGVAVLWMDVVGDAVNTLKATFAEEFAEAFAEIEDKAELKAVVFASAKKAGFIAGADVEMLEAAKSAHEASHLSRVGQQAMQQIEDFRVPVVAAIHGACLGGGLELALACRGRVASDARQTKLGLPEVQLGLIPGAGGTQRLPRLIGIQAALDLILTGKQVPARKAKSLGLVDEVVSPAILVEVAAEHALRLAAGKSQKKAGKGFNLAKLQTAALEDNPLGRKLLFDQARKQLLKKTRGHYAAPERALDAVKIGMESGASRGYEVEATAFGELVVSRTAQRLMEIFFATTELKKDSGVDDPKVKAVPISKVGVLGAGFMGSGVAYVTAQQAEIPVRIKDRDDEALRRGLASVAKVLDGRVKRKRMSKIERDQVMATVRPTTDWSGFDGAEVVIEAVFEDLKLKQTLLKELEAHTAGHERPVIFASNTSSLPITQIAEKSAHPEAVIGMHYFSPVHKMPLLEIIVTEQTADWVTATCVELGKKQGKTVIVVRDGVGFYTSRILGPYVNEAAHLLAEGVRIEDIDAALLDWGFPVGPIALLDEVGIDVGYKVSHILHEAFGERLSPPPGLDKLLEDGRHGRKNDRGFYVYGTDKKKGGKQVDKSVYEALGVEPKTKMTASYIAERVALQMVNEAALCYGEGIVRSARDADIGAIFGLGFPPFLGGPCRYVDSEGAANVVKRLEALEQEHGARFKPAPVLVELAKRGVGFYDKNAPAPGEKLGTVKAAEPRAHA